MLKETTENPHYSTKKQSTGTKNGLGINSGTELFFGNRIEREWLTTKEAACFLSVTPNALRIMVHRDQVPVYKFGRRLRFRQRDCVALFPKLEKIVDPLLRKGEMALFTAAAKAGKSCKYF